MVEHWTVPGLRVEAVRICRECSHVDTCSGTRPYMVMSAVPKYVKAEVTDESKGTRHTCQRL